jgi:hypothetical protein
MGFYVPVPRNRDFHQYSIRNKANCFCANRHLFEMMVVVNTWQNTISTEKTPFVSFLFLFYFITLKLYSGSCQFDSRIFSFQ